MLTPSTKEAPQEESTGARVCLLHDGTFVDPAELSELVGIFRAVLPDSTDDEARRGLHADVLQGTGWRFSHLSRCVLLRALGRLWVQRVTESCSPNYSRGTMHEDSTLHAPIESAPCNSGW